jgi:predicted DNA binding CopG/RHH family protein
MLHKPKRQRINMRVPGDLLDWVKRFASKKNTNVTQLFVDHVTQLRERHDGKSAR